MFSKVSKSPSKTDGGSAKGRSTFISHGVAPSIISANLKITGDLVSDGDIQIDGVVEGDVRSGSVTVGEHATVKGSIEADKVHVAGIVNGQINGRVVEFMRSARVTGDVLHESLAIEAGAFIQGMCRHVPGKATQPQTGTATMSEDQAKEPPRDAAVSPLSTPASAVALDIGSSAPATVAGNGTGPAGGLAAAAAARGQEMVRKVFR